MEKENEKEKEIEKEKEEQCFSSLLLEGPRASEGATNNWFSFKNCCSLKEQ